MNLCVDIGNSRVKLALFAGGAEQMSTPHETLAIASDPRGWSELDRWLDALATNRSSLQCWIASVQTTTCRTLVARLQKRAEIARTQTLTWQEFPMRVCVDHPERVGVDRLAAALAARELVAQNRGAVVVDFGTAVTIDRVSASGTFEGGAILPGVELAARALNTLTDALPHVELLDEAEPAVLPGKSTEAAITAGLYWGVIGSIREIVGRLVSDEDPQEAEFITGGAAASWAPKLGFAVQHAPDLVLQGIALAAKSILSAESTDSAQVTRGQTND